MRQQKKVILLALLSASCLPGGLGEVVTTAAGNTVASSSSETSGADSENSTAGPDTTGTTGVTTGGPSTSDGATTGTPSTSDGSATSSTDLTGDFTTEASETDGTTSNECLSMADVKCSQGDLYYYDSCGKIEGLAQECDDNNVCTDDSCDFDSCINDPVADQTPCGGNNICMSGSCVEEGEQQCVSGACCENGVFLPSSTMCEENAVVELSCPWGDEPGEDVGSRSKDRYCSGQSAECDGDLGMWSVWVVSEDCEIDETCDSDTNECVSLPDCTDGPCCSNGSFLDSGTVCQENVQQDVGCPWGTSPGDDVGSRTRDRYCSGASGACDGNLGDWSEWSTLDDCNAQEICVPGDATCNPATLCVSGPCCQDGLFAPSDVVCEVAAETEYSCPWGTSPGDDVGVKTRDRYCSGNSPDCAGNLGAWSNWSVADYCSTSEECEPGDPTCNELQECISGPCCDNGLFANTNVTCDEDLDYGCPWGTDPGDNVGVRSRDRFCSGASASCSGSWSPWSGWSTQDNCSITEICDPGDPTCDIAPCQASQYWIANIGSDTDHYGQQHNQTINVPITITVKEDGSSLQYRICKSGSKFEENVKVSMYDGTGNGNANVNDSFVATKNEFCSDWESVDDVTGYVEGEKFGGIWNLISPSTSASDWPQWGGCSVQGNPTGTCWNGLDITLTRTCKGL